MSPAESFVLFDPVKEIKINGEFLGSIISVNSDPANSIIFSDNIKIADDLISIKEALLVGFEDEFNEKVAFSRKSDFSWANLQDCPIEYSVLIPKEIMDIYDEGQFSDAFPFTINLLHTAGLYLEDSDFEIDHLEFFKGEILKNPISLVFNGFCIADRVSIDHRGDPVFYDCIIVGRDQNDDLKVSYDPILNIKIADEALKYIIILGIEELKF
jgi:hypothetical protein